MKKIIFMMLIGFGVTPAYGQDAKTADEKYQIILTEYTGEKLAAIKALRKITDGGLKETKDMVEDAPVVIKVDMTEAEASLVIQKAAGGPLVLTAMSNGQLVDLTKKTTDQEANYKIKLYKREADKIKMINFIKEMNKIGLSEAKKIYESNPRSNVFIAAENLTLNELKEFMRIANQRDIPFSTMRGNDDYRPSLDAYDFDSTEVGTLYFALGAINCHKMNVYNSRLIQQLALLGVIQDCAPQSVEAGIEDLEHDVPRNYENLDDAKKVIALVNAAQYMRGVGEKYKHHNLEEYNKAMDEPVSYRLSRLISKFDLNAQDMNPNYNLLGIEPYAEDLKAIYDRVVALHPILIDERPDPLLSH